MVKGIFFFVSDYLDSYKALVFKAVAWMTWVAKNCPNVDFVVKTDDDIIINMFPLAQYLNEAPEMKTMNKFQCLLWSEKGMKIERNPDSKW